MRKSVLTLLIISVAINIFLLKKLWDIPKEHIESIQEVPKDNHDLEILKKKIFFLREKAVLYEHDHNLLKKIIKYSSNDGKIFKIKRISSYSPSSNETDDDPYKTAIGQRPIPGFSAAVSRDLSFMLGKIIYIPGLGIRYVNDLMNRRYKRSIDICLGTKSQCKKFGVLKNKNVCILYIR